MRELKSLCGNPVVLLSCLVASSHGVEANDATLKGGATRSPLLGVSTQALKPPTR